MNERQQQILRTLLDRLIPPDEFPGAWEAGVGDYLFGQFAGDLQNVLPDYRAGLDSLDREAFANHAVGFVELDADTQGILLSSVERGEVAAEWSVEPRRFFRQVVQHAHEGYYGDPGNGGNRFGVGWQMIGFTVRG